MRPPSCTAAVMMSDSTESHAQLGERTSHNRVIRDAGAPSRNGSRSRRDSPGAHHLRAMTVRPCGEIIWACDAGSPSPGGSWLTWRRSSGTRVARTLAPCQSGLQRTIGNRNGEPHGTKPRADCVPSMPHVALPGVRMPYAAKAEGHVPCSIRATLRSRSSDRMELNDSRLTPVLGSPATPAIITAASWRHPGGQPARNWAAILTQAWMRSCAPPTSCAAPSTDTSPTCRLWSSRWPRRRRRRWLRRSP